MFSNRSSTVEINPPCSKQKKCKHILFYHLGELLTTLHSHRKNEIARQGMCEDMHIHIYIHIYEASTSLNIFSTFSLGLWWLDG